MGIFDNVKTRAACSRVSEEALYAKALREVEAGLRRDGLWAKALADSGMNHHKAMAEYLKLRVQSLRDEFELEAQHLRQPSARIVETQNTGPRISPSPHERETPRPVHDLCTSEFGNKVANVLGIILLLVLVIPVLLTFIF